MTYNVVVAHKTQNVVVSVVADDATSAHAIAHWMVAHNAHLQAPAVRVETKSAGKR
jgi:hypothetical protein